MEDKKLIRFLEGSSTPEEEREIHAWFEEKGARQKFDLFLEKYFETPKPKRKDTTDYAEVLKNIHEKIHLPERKSRSKVKKLIIKGMKTAASILLVVASGYIMLKAYQDRNTAEVKMGEVKVTTTTRVTGPGEKLTLTMSDKTVITVNSKSEISFTSSYNEKERVINLKGEAYFEIAPDSLRPFRVESEEITTTALGTAFNVYAREGQIKIALTEGKVSVAKSDREVRLLPGQMALWERQNPDKTDFLVKNFNKDEIEAWREGKLIIDRKPLSEILADLEAWYQVEMQIDKGVELDKKVIGTFENKNLRDVLTGLSFSTGFDFEINGKNVRIKKQLPM